MAEMEPYWDLWARYWAFVEDIFLNIGVIDKLATSIESPVLIVGAGQGMLGSKIAEERFGRHSGASHTPFQEVARHRGLRKNHDIRRCLVSSHLCENGAAATEILRIVGLLWPDLGDGDPRIRHAGK